MERHHRGLVAIGSVAVLIGMPAAASADTLTASWNPADGFTVRMTESANGHGRNHLRVGNDAEGNLILEDLGEEIDVVAGESCSQLTIDRVLCPRDPAMRTDLEITVGRGADFVSLQGLSGGKSPVAGIVVGGGGGPDVILGSKFNDRFEGDYFNGRGEADELLVGNDTLVGFGGRDTLRGGDGDDYLNPAGTAPALDGHVGAEIVDGGGGADYLDAGTSLDPDVWGGGSGSDAPMTEARLAGAPNSVALANGLQPDVRGGDTVAYGPRTFTSGGTAGVRADLDGAADDGGAGEGDRILGDVESLQGTIRDDALTGNAGRNRLEGLLGVDALSGGLNADELLLKDGVRDQCFVVTPGDVVVADAIDERCPGGTPWSPFQ